MVMTYLMIFEEIMTRHGRSCFFKLGSVEILDQ